MEAGVVKRVNMVSSLHAYNLIVCVLLDLLDHEALLGGLGEVENVAIKVQSAFVLCQ